MDFVARSSPESNGGAMASVPKGGAVGAAPAATYRPDSVPGALGALEVFSELAHT